MSVAWFIDGGYAFEAFRDAAGPDARIDYLKFREQTEDDAKEQITEAYYFNSDNNPPSTEQDGFHRFLKAPVPRGPNLRVKLYWLQSRRLHWPAHMGGGPVAHPETGQAFEQKSQKGVDFGIAFHMIRSFSKVGWERLYLVAGDGDFAEVVQHLVENEGVKVSIIGTKNSVSGELAPYCEIIDFADIHNLIAMEPRTNA